MDPQIYDLLKTGGLTAGLVALCWLLMSGKLLAKWQMDAMRESLEKQLAEKTRACDQWQSMALRLMSTSERQAETSSRVAGIAEKAVGQSTGVPGAP